MYDFRASTPMRQFVRVGFGLSVCGHIVQRLSVVSVKATIGAMK
jgi:hypothetical protein